MDLFRNKIFIAGIIVLVVVVIGGAGTYFILSRKTVPQKPVIQEQSIKNLSPQDIGLSLTLSPDKRNVDMEITKLNGIKSVEGVFNYSDEETDPETKQATVVPQGGLIAAESISSDQTKIERKITLGTCSATCRYPKIVSDIKFILKITFKDGSVGQVEQTVLYPHSK